GAEKERSCPQPTGAQLENRAMDLLHVDARLDRDLLELRQGKRTHIGRHGVAALLKLGRPPEDLVHLLLGETLRALDCFTHRIEPNTAGRVETSTCVG